MKRSDAFTPVRARQFGILGLAILGVMMAGAPVLLAAPAVYAQASQGDITRGYTLLRQGRVDAAITNFERILRQNPNNLEALQGLGIAYRRAGRDADALAIYQQILGIDADNQLALSTLGYLGEFRAEWQPIGIQALTRLLQITPDSIEARAQRAKLYFYQGLFSESLADYAVVLPRTAAPDILRPAAEAYTFSGDYVTGLSLFERYRSNGGVIAGDTAIAYAQALQDSGQLAQAAQILEQELRGIAEFSTQNIRLRGALASTYAASRQFQPALDLLQPLRGRLDSRLTLARALNAIGDYSGQTAYNQEAAALYQEVLATGPGLTVGTQREAISALSALPNQRALALQLTQQLARMLPNDSSLTLQQQVLAYQTGTLSRANFIQQVRTTFPNLPADPVQTRNIAQILSRLDPPLAEIFPLYQSLLAAGTTDAFLNFRVAQIYTQQGQYANARSALSAYMATPVGSQDPATIQLLLAEVDRREGNLAASAQRYQTLLSTAQLPSVRNAAVQGLATIYRNQGLWSDAIALYDQLIAENPQDLSYQLGRATVAYQVGEITDDQAEAILQQILRQSTGGPLPAELVTLATALPPSPSRVDLYQQLLAIEPSNPQLQLRSLQVLAESNPRQAQAQISQLIAQNPNAVDLYFVQGEIAQQVGDYELARQIYTGLLQQQPNSLDAWLALAGLEFQQGNYAQANTLYQSALSLDIENSTARTSLAALNAVQGRPLEALEQLQAWQQVMLAQGNVNSQMAEQIQQIQEGLLQQRGIQPYWERF